MICLAEAGKREELYEKRKLKIAAKRRLHLAAMS